MGNNKNVVLVRCGWGIINLCDGLVADERSSAGMLYVHCVSRRQL